ncbi:AfsR/SARP family transcriptional regulator [Streptomyces aculeolatus]
MDFRILGALETRDGTGSLLKPSRRKQRLLLAVLLLRANTPVSTETLLDLLWSDAAPSSARANLQSYVSDLRRLLQRGEPAEAPRLYRANNGYALRAGPAELDAAVFEELAVEGRRALGEQRYSCAVERLTGALAQWRGAVLEDVPLPAALQPEAERLEELRSVVREDCVQARLEIAEPAPLAAELAALTARHPLRERLWAQLMLALYRAGRQADALAAYRRVHRLLDQELGVRPGRMLQNLHRQILSADPVLTPPPAPVRIARQVPRQLPPPPQMFTGRLREVAALELVEDASAVVISAIDGMAGIGKTALAVHVAHRIAGRFPDGQLFIDLHGYTPGVAPVAPDEALDQVLRALGTPPPQIPDGVEERAALFRTRLADRRMLIVLDNAAAENQVAPLLPGAPGCLVLVTSRRRLAGLDSTGAVSLDTLPLPDGVGLFVRTVGEQRVRDEPPALLAELVELCGRLPMAIRISAARLRSHPAWDVALLVDRLRDQHQRLHELEAGHRSVAAALDMSYRHLSPGQQRTYRLLGLHPGPDIDAYATAALLDSTVPHAGRMVEQLLDVHLLHEPAPGRYRFHDLVRAHAARTAAGGPAEHAARAALTRLFDYYRHTAARAADAAYPYRSERRPDVPVVRTPRPDLPDAATALGWLDGELPNLLAAAKHATERGRPEYVSHLSSILHRHLRTRGRYHDALALHDQAVSAARVTGQHVTELEALTGLGHIHRRQGRYAQAGEHYQRALRIARATGHHHGELDALSGLGQIYLLQGRRAQAGDHYQRALRIARATGHHHGELDALTGLGHIHRLQGRRTQATGLFEQALRVANAAGHRPGEPDALAGLIHRLRGRYAQAIVHYRRLLDLARETGNRNWQFEAHQGLGRLRYATGDPAGALTHHDQALALAGELGQPVDQARAHSGLARAHQALGRRKQARGHWQHALTILAGVGIDETDDEETTTAAIRTHLAGPAGCIEKRTDLRLLL